MTDDADCSQEVKEKPINSDKFINTSYDTYLRDHQISELLSKKRVCKKFGLGTHPDLTLHAQTNGKRSRQTSFIHHNIRLQGTYHDTSLHSRQHNLFD
jgi:hypothetical protein